MRHRFITLEELSDEATVFGLLDTHKTDYAIGDMFFDDHFRMHQGTVIVCHYDVVAYAVSFVLVCPDALCGGAKIALDALFPSTANTTQGCFADFQ